MSFRQRRTLRSCFGRGAYWLVLPLAGVAISGVSFAQPSAKETAPPAAVAAAPGLAPDPYKLNLLIRTTLIALNQANFTGNYSVLRDLGTPQFQATNSDARLAEIFAPLRRRNVDFSPILFFDPKLVREPMLDASGAVRVTGFIPTSPERVIFDLGFAAVAGQWRLSAIVIDLQRQSAQPIPPPRKEKKPQGEGAASESTEASRRAKSR